jgi:hypothetical protein
VGTDHNQPLFLASQPTKVPTPFFAEGRPKFSSEKRRPSPTLSTAASIIKSISIPILCANYRYLAPPTSPVPHLNICSASSFGAASDISPNPDTPMRDGHSGPCRKMQDNYYQQRCRAIRCDEGSSQRRTSG